MKNYIKTSLYIAVIALAAVFSNNVFADPEEGARVCTEGGCYVFKCTGQGSNRTCSWSFEEDDPLDRDFNEIE